jgi:hypothetical protein
MKNNQIALLVLVFVVCGACGFFLGRLVVGARNNAEPEVVIEVE